MLMSYSQNKFPEEYVPTVFDNYTSMIVHKDYLVKLNLWDTAGQVGFESIRPVSYSGANVFLLCFDLTNRVSYYNVKEKWLPELRTFFVTTGEKVPIVLVGTKSDVRKIDKTHVSASEGIKLAKQLNCKGYYECSALTQDGLQSLFKGAIDAILNFKGKKKKSSGGGGGTGGSSGSSDNPLKKFFKNLTSCFKGSGEEVVVQSL